MFRISISLALCLGLLVGATSTNFRGNIRDHQDEAARKLVIDGWAVGDELLERRAQSNNEVQYFKIDINVAVNETEVPTLDCDPDKQRLMQNEIDLLFLDYGVGDLGDGKDHTCALDDRISPSGCIASGGKPCGYIFLVFAPCRFCGRDNHDKRRVLTATAEELSIAFDTYINTTFIPNHPTCLGVTPSIKIEVKEVTMSVLEEQCALPPPEAVLPPHDFGPNNNGELVDASGASIIKKPEIRSSVSWTYKTPDWWANIQDKDSDLCKCHRREYPPRIGGKCATKSKKCYWGDQQCSGSDAHDALLPHPTTVCYCDGSQNVEGKWKCDAVACPI